MCRAPFRDLERSKRDYLTSTSAPAFLSCSAIFSASSFANRADLLDDRDLVGTGGLEDDVELRLLLSGGSTTSGGTGDGHGSGGADAPRLFEGLHEVVDFENGLARQFLDDFFVSHCLVSFVLLVNPGRFSCQGNFVYCAAASAAGASAAGAASPSPAVASAEAGPFLAFSERTRARRVAGSLRSMRSVARS